MGELLGLKWGDIDWNQKFIRVERSYKRGKYSATKTKKVRRVDVSDQLFGALKQLLTERNKEALKKGTTWAFKHTNDRRYLWAPDPEQQPRCRKSA